MLKACIKISDQIDTNVYKKAPLYYYSGALLLIIRDGVHG